MRHTLLLSILLGACAPELNLAPIKDPVPDPVDSDAGFELDQGKPPVEDPVADTDDTAVAVPDEEEPPVEDPPPVDDCALTSDLIYLVSRSDRSMVLFDPTTLQTRSLGVLDCSVYGDPQSMAVSRTGHAYVRWSDDSIYDVDLSTGQCAPTSYAPGAFGAFGMGYATDSAGTWRDQLYIANASRLAKLDGTTWRRDLLGTLPSQSELTGNAQGELWAFLPLERPAQLAEIDKSTGATLRAWSLPNFPKPIDIDAFAFAAWGGEFFLFVREFGVGNSTDVYKVDAAGRMTLVRERIGLDIVGAGTSTCAPSP